MLLRSFTIEDAPALREAVEETRESLLRWLPWGDQHRSTEESAAFCAESHARILAREDYDPLAIFTLESGRFLGGAGLHVRDAEALSFELGYWIRASAEGRGYVQEAVRVLVGAVFEHVGANRVMVCCDSKNERSRRVIARAGFVPEGILRRTRLRRDGTLRDTLVFAMVREDYQAAKTSWELQTAPG